ncbi:MAG: SRPBCC domain-containing protein [Nitrososphaerales archaeon]
MAQTLEYAVTVAAPAAEVFRAFTRATPLRDWLCDVALADARPGGRIYLWWNRGYYTAGEYTALDPERRVSFTWAGRNEPARTQVDVQLAPRGGCTDVRLTHSGLGEGEEWDRARREFDRGWTAALENLQSLLETGQDLRYTRRPMLGVTLDDFNPAIAAELGVPVTEGVRITGVMPGMAAAAAGLQGNDVLVSVNGQPVVDYPALVATTQDKRAGDTVEVDYYRGNEHRTVPMTLSARWLPEIPATPRELAEAIRNMNVELMAELRREVEGVPEDQARVRPDNHSWSAMEVMAHLVVNERETHAWLADMINDDERFSDRYTNSTSVNARVDAVVTVHASVGAMIQAVRDALTETEEIVANMPDEVTAHRGNYWRIGHNLLQNDQHWHEHMEQIQDALTYAQQEIA